MENIQVNAANNGSINASSASVQPKSTLLMYHSNKSCKKEGTQKGAAMAPIPSQQVIKTDSTKH